MSRKRFRFYFQPSAGIYYAATGGTVGVTGTKTRLKADPVDWATINLKFARNAKYHGVFREYALSASFVRDGAAILRYVYMNQGAEGYCLFVVEKLNDTTQEYDAYYQGVVDFTESQGTLTTFKVKIVDDGLSALLKAKETTPYETPILDADSVKVYMDGLALQSTQGFTIIQHYDGGTHKWAMPNFIPVAATSLEGYSAGSPRDENVMPLGGVTPDLNNDYQYQATQAQSLEIKISNLLVNHTIDVTGLGPSRIQIWVRYGQPSGVYNDALVWDGATMIMPGQSSSPPPIFASYTIPLNGPSIIGATDGDKVALYFMFYTTLGGIAGAVPNVTQMVEILNGDGILELIPTFRPAPIIYHGYRLNELWSKHVVQMTGGLYSFHSDYLSNASAIDEDMKPWNVIASSGDAMRRLGDGTFAALAPRIITTLEELHTDSLSRTLTGVGVEGAVLRVEKQGYFYNNSIVTADIGMVTKFQHDVAKDYLFNLFNIGYEPINNDNIGGSLNGRYDYHNTLSFASSGIHSLKTFEAISKYIASMYAVNFICFNLNDKNTTDTKQDDRTYLVEIQDLPNTFGEYPPARRQNDAGNSVSGVLVGDTVFNLGLSPKRNMKRLAPYLHVGLHRQEATTLTYQTAEKNTAVISDLGSGNVIESADVPISTLAAPLFLPILFSFETKVPRNIVDAVMANPYGRINFTVVINDRRITLGGFIDTISVQPGNNEAQKWTLLAAPDTDLSQLIYQY